jgi:hypothetical protein
VFPKGWFSEQAIHEAFVGAGGRIRLKGFYFVGGRREAGKIKRTEALIKTTKPDEVERLLDQI